jgi:hypothetical protein
MGQRSARDYRRQAAECLEVALRLSDAEEKAHLVQTARALLVDLASTIERNFLKTGLI